MKARLKILFIFLFALGINESAKAQLTIKEFSSDSIQFLEEINTLLSNSRKKEAKIFIDEFEPVWYGGVFSEGERKAIYRTCNFMLKKKMQPFPDFRDYLYSMMSFIKSDQPIESLEAWQSSLEKIIGGKSKKRFTDYLKFSSKLFEDNAIYSSSSTVWKSSNSNYIFEFEDGKPKVIFPSLDLVCLAKGDSSVIHDTKGYYYPTLKVWYGEGGIVDWTRAGFDENNVYAELVKYKIETKSAAYEADSVSFHNKQFFEKPLLGKMSEKVLANITKEKASYPRFDSYDKRLKIYDIEENVDYDGGFSQHGRRFIGSGNEEEDALMVFKRNNLPLLIVSSKSFVIRPERFSSKDAAIKLVLEEDSIVHPSLKFNFLVESRVLSLVRSEEGISQSPYFNTFHRLDMLFEALYWKIDDPLMELRSLKGSTDKSAKFESEQFYKGYIYDRLQGIDRIHPLVGIKSCALEIGQEQLYASEVARCMKLPITQIRPMLMKLAALGYLYYDFDDDRITVKEKLYHYVNAKAEKEDYDVIRFNSRIDKKSNATLNLLNYDLTIRGVKNVLLSDSQKVFIFPKEHTVVVKKNRNFDFSGVINAGKFEYFGNDFSFNYDNFNITMPQIDSLRIWANTPKKDDKGRRQERKVISVLEDLRGVLSIDQPDNKSGTKDLPRYPIFDSQKDSYVFYDKGSIQQGVYNRDNFYFHVEPFIFDSLKTFENKAVALDGTFVSGDIFPDFEEKLRIMPDYSLGFERPTPPDGFKMYKDKGQFFAKINLSHRGLRGDGKLKYVTSTTMSNDFVFFPDSMNAIAQNHVIEERPTTVEFPPVSAQNVDIHWEPFNDHMKVTVIREPIAMYDGSKLFGHIDIRPKGLEGGGLIHFEDAELESNLYKFKFADFRADTADFRLKTLENSTLAFSTKNVNAHIDFRERKGDFLSNGGGSFIDFPVNQYICYMDKFTWYMDDESIELGADEVSEADQAASDVKLEGSKFISTHPDQDSLSFYAPAAKYDLRKNVIFADKIKFIPVADALIYPDSGKAVIEKKAKMRPLNNAIIVANSVTKYHKLYEADVKIKARRNYNASGKYDYKDENKKVHTFIFEDITVDTAYQTVANGKILEEEGFTLSPNFEFVGDVGLRATNQFLTFNGVAKILHSCEAVSSIGFKFESEIDPEEIYIPIDSTIKDSKNDRLSAGIMMNKDSAHIYPSFLSRLKKAIDLPVLSANGYLFYDKKSREYRISNKEKLREISLPGNYLSINTRDCNLYGEGVVDFTANLGQVEATTVGSVSNYFTEDSTVLDVMILLDFFFIENNMEGIAKVIKDREGIEPIDFDRDVYERGLREIVGKEAGDKLISQVSLYGNFKKFPSELNKSMFLNEVKMKWNSETQSFQSIGKIGVGNFYKKQVNKYVTGYVEVNKKRVGDEIGIYLEIDRDNWYFFNYKRNFMNIISSDEKFNNSIKELKSDKRKVKAEKGQAPYSFMLSTTKRKNDFVKRFEGDD